MSIQDERLYADDLVEAAIECMKKLAIPDILCEYESGILFLRGQVPSYYHKQLVQEAVVKIKGVAQIVNEIEVVSRPR